MEPRVFVNSTPITLCYFPDALYHALCIRLLGSIKVRGQVFPSDIPVSSSRLQLTRAFWAVNCINRLADTILSRMCP